MAKQAIQKNQGTEEFFTLLTDFDIHLFNTGKHFKLYEKLGAHPAAFDGQKGTYFAVWAPNAVEVSVIGNFNHWKGKSHPLSPRWDGSGIWEGFHAGIQHGEAYKYAIQSVTGQCLEKADPFGRFFETPPRTASVVWDGSYEWKDAEWL